MSMQLILIIVLLVSPLFQFRKHHCTVFQNDININSNELDTLQDIITEVGKSQPSSGDRKVEAIINQLITGQVGLNYLKS